MSESEETPDWENIAFPGPLMSERLQKEDLLRFIQNKCQDCVQLLDDPDQINSYFFWTIVEYFYGRNGKIMRFEIGRLLFRVYGFVRRKIGRVITQQDWCLPLARLLCSAATGDGHTIDIIKLGDNFESRKLTFASHMCYVVAHLDLGSRKTFHLVGSEWFPSFNNRVPKPAMERTEVYEYLLCLISGIGQPRFQEAKLVYARNLAESGCVALALDYCESIARSIFKFPRLNRCYFLVRLIKFCDELLQEKGKDVDWMMKLCRLHRAIAPPSCTDVFYADSIPDRPEEFQEELISNYTIGALLGKGAFGTVYSAVRKADGRKVALKYVYKSSEEIWPGMKPVEVKLMEILCEPPRCENILEMLEWLDMSMSFILVLEHPNPCIDLHTFCKSHKNGRLPEPRARVVMRQVVRAAHHCFDRQVFHGDLRPHNFLINTDTLEVKMIDFGCGELLSNNYQRLSSYMWSLAWILVELVCGDTYYYNTAELDEKCSQLASKDCFHLIMSCLKDPGRPTFNQILNHRWFNISSL